MKTRTANLLAMAAHRKQYPPDVRILVSYNILRELRRLPAKGGLSGRQRARRKLAAEGGRLRRAGNLNLH